MALIPDALRGPLTMLVATGSYVINDTMMKLATSGLPPYEVLVLRGIAATLWGIPLLLLLGQGRQMKLMADRRVLIRNLLETFAIMTYVVALAHMPIADSSALGQITPLVVLLGAALFFGEKISLPTALLVALGFTGALMVAQPTMNGISIYAGLALATAVFGAMRDLASRKVGAEIPGMIVAISAVLVVLAGGTIGHLLTETWVVPTSHHLWLMAGAGFFLIFGHFFIFLAYRTGPSGAVAPFYYSFSIWAVISGLVVFGQFPNRLAISGMALVIVCGITIVTLDERKRRLAITA